MCQEKVIQQCNEKGSSKGKVDEKFNCCKKVFSSHIGIHQGKVCQKEVIQQHRLKIQKTCSQNLLEGSHSKGHSIGESEQPGKEIGMKRPKIKWVKANEELAIRNLMMSVFYTSIHIHRQVSHNH
ncbi:Hypothetical predicted protein [Octopus vulgaris]|uniref:Uncharacterized protein n=1 Tax=Octopus vulgaris TaxID=6645 RepID=A0AA36B992_OCTVU|nr:Hypothetical predicted protein [Octopus vulgaris]